jgi:hypothetical protein
MANTEVNIVTGNMVAEAAAGVAWTPLEAPGGATTAATFGDFVYARAAGGSSTVTVPAPALVNGKAVSIGMVLFGGGGNLIISCVGGQNINGAPSQTYGATFTQVWLTPDVTGNQWTLK